MEGIGREGIQLYLLALSAELDDVAMPEAGHVHKLRVDDHVSSSTPLASSHPCNAQFDLFNVEYVLKQMHN